MKTRPIVPAQVRFDDGVPFAPAFDDVYHARAGAFAQARAVFMQGSGLPERWRQRRRFVILETGFGLGNNFLATWQAWRDDADRCEQLVFVSVEKHPLSLEDLRRAHADSQAPALAAELLARWPVLTPDMHTLEFDGGRVRLLLALGDLADWQSELVGEVDAFYLDGFAPAKNAAMWDARLYPALARLAAPDATAATWSVARDVRDGLTAAGFEVRRVPGFGGKRDRCEARYQGVGRSGQRLVPPPGRRSLPQARQALVIGAGVAGAACAHALARDGLAVTVLERRAQPAEETSSNLVGMFHGVLHPHDGAHAQLLRAAALRTQQVLTPLLSDELPGATDGLLRGAAGGDAVEMRALAERLGLPAGYVQALDAEAASAAAGVPLAHAQWLYGGGGWVSPPAFVKALLRAPGITMRTDAAVARLHRTDDGRWQALGPNQEVLACADVVVLAAAGDGLSLLDGWHDEARAWPLGRQRGQVTRLPPALAQGLPHPTRPLASGGYVITVPERLGGGLLCGATNQPGDTDAAVRPSDHARNLAHLSELVGVPVDPALAEHVDVQGKVGWRLACDDRLPLVGPVPAPQAQRQGARRQEQVRQVPRIEGLYLMTALGSRGLTLAALLGDVLSAWITGAPMPLAASLLDAIDPARFIARAARKTPP